MPDLRAQGGSGQTASHSHEGRDISVRLIVVFGIALTVTLVGSHFLLRALFSSYSEWADRRDRPPPPLREGRVLPPEPRLETHPELDLQALRRDEDRRLNTYGWIDREKRILRIPIEDAIGLVLRRGIPARSATRGSD